MRRTLLRPDPVEAPTTRRNPLYLPLVIVSNIAVIEAIVVVVLLSAGRSHDPAPAPASANPAAAGAAGAAAAQPAPVSPSYGSPAPTTTITLIARGTIGRKVRSAGFAMTVERIAREPTLKELGTVEKDKRYLALLLAVENNSGADATLYPAEFTLKDAQGVHYQALNLHLIPQALESRAMRNRETVRGYVDFTIPANTKNLTLVYPLDPQPIHIDLGE